MFCSFVQNMCLFYYNTEHLFCQGGVFLVLFMEKVPKPPLRVDEGVTFSFEKVTKENRSFADWNSLNSSVSFAAKAKGTPVVLRQNVGALSQSSASRDGESGIIGKQN